MMHDQLPLHQLTEHVTINGQRLRLSVDIRDHDDARIVTVTAIPLDGLSLNEETIAVLKRVAKRTGTPDALPHRPIVQISGRLTLTYEAEFLRVWVQPEEERGDAL